MLLYCVVSAQTERVVEFFIEREAVETMIGEVQEDDGRITHSQGADRHVPH
jgi:selenophosphate synthetase-related protein